MPDVPGLITALARKYGVDPRAALAVASVEGGTGYGAVGDNGSSFGPFQLHVGGALPAGQGAGFANSPQGLEYAIRKMAESGARGLTGEQAVTAIVRNFERPADPGSEIARALAHYGSGSSTGSGGGSGPAFSSAGAAPPAQASPDLRRQLALSMIGNLQGQQGAPDLGQLLRLAQQARAQQPQAAPAPAAAAPSGDTAGLEQKYPGVDPRLLQFADKFGLQITSGKRDEQRNRMVGGAPGSYHLSGQAVDVAPGRSFSALAGFAHQHPGLFTELFGPMPWYIKNGKIHKGAFPGHSDHGHMVLAG